MEYGKAVIENGRLVVTETKTINQANLSSECWMVQFNGLTACESCEYLDTEDCGGKEIRKNGKNEKGIKVPE